LWRRLRARCDLPAGTRHLASSDDPAAAGDAIDVHIRGLAAESVARPQVTIGGRLAAVLSVTMAPDASVVSIVRVRVPPGIVAGPAVPVRLYEFDRPSNATPLCADVRARRPGLRRAHAAGEALGAPGHGAWSWDEVAPLLREPGHRVLTPRLTGLGDRSHLARPAVGHRSSGAVITGVADRVPDRLGTSSIWRPWRWEQIEKGRDGNVVSGGRFPDVQPNACGNPAPDIVAKWPPTEVSEGYNDEAVQENYVITDNSHHTGAE
jgi:hypothetical protein